MKFFDVAITPKVLHALKLHRLHIALVQDKLVVLCHMLDMDIGSYLSAPEDFPLETK